VVGVELTAPTFTLHVRGPVVTSVEVRGVPNSVIEVRVNDKPVGIIRLDATGYAAGDRERWLSGQQEITVRYVVDGRAGPLVPAIRVEG
jgi:hypothetical protein